MITTVLADLKYYFWGIVVGAAATWLLLGSSLLLVISSCLPETRDHHEELKELEDILNRKDRSKNG